MNKSKQFILAASLFALFQSNAKGQAVHFWDRFDQMMKHHDQMMASMHKQMAKMHDEMMNGWLDQDQASDEQSDKTKDRTGQQEKSTSISFNQDDSNVIATMKNIEIPDADKIDSHVSNNNLLMTVPLANSTMTIVVKKHPYFVNDYIMAVQVKHERKEEHKKDDARYSTSVSYGNYQMQHMLPSAVDLDNVEVEYVKQDKTLTIKLPKLMAKKVRVIQK